MFLEAKILNPVCIKLGKNSDIILADENNKENHPLIPGAIFGGDHYGFVLIIDYNGKQKEIVYPTQCRIEAAGLEGNHLKIFEEGKKFYWKFDKTGKLEHSAFNEFTDKFRTKLNTIIENSNMFMETPVLQNPIRIKMALNPEESMILNAENITESYPLYPGAMFGTIHYGFILIIETENGIKERAYPTQNRIDAVGMEKGFYDLQIFENGKYHPWRFTHTGQLKQESSYNPYSKKDKSFFDERYGLDETNSEYCFTLQRKK